MIKYTKDMSNTWVVLRLDFLRNRLKLIFAYRNLMKNTFVNNFKVMEED